VLLQVGQDGFDVGFIKHFTRARARVRIGLWRIMGVNDEKRSWVAEVCQRAT
jgi:hypothetical protein